MEPSSPPGEPAISLHDFTDIDFAPLVAPGGTVTGVDHSAAFLDEGRRRAAGAGLDVEFEQGDAQQLPVPDDAAGVTRAERVLIYLDDPDRALAEMVRVTRPGGRIAIIEPDFDTNTVNVPDVALVRAVLAHEADTAVVNARLVRDLTARLAALGLTDVAIASRMVVFDPDLPRTTSAASATPPPATARSTPRWGSAGARSSTTGTAAASSSGPSATTCSRRPSRADAPVSSDEVRAGGPIDSSGRPRSGTPDPGQPLSRRRRRLPLGFRLLPRVHPRHHLRKTYRLGPVRLHLGPEGVSWGLGAGRWSWNAKSGRHTVDTPGPGYWQSKGREPRP